jgi:hypothetical protein
MDPEAGAVSVINRFYERAATGLGFTQGAGLHFHSRAEWLAMLQDAGFVASAEPFTRFPFSDVLFTCRRAP